MTAIIPRSAWPLLLAAGLAATAGCGHRTQDDVPAAGRIPLRAVGENTEALRTELQRLYDQVR